jgi:hypothetical protein
VFLTQFVQWQGNEGGEEEGNESERDWVVLPCAVAALPSGEAFDEGDDAFEIEKNKSENSACLDNDGVHLPIRIVERDTHCGFGDPEMRGRTDRKKFGEALNDA